MASKNPAFTVLALVRSVSGVGRDAKEVTSWIPIGALWDTAEKDLHTGRVNALPVQWLGPNRPQVLEIAIRDNSARSCASAFVRDVRPPAPDRFELESFEAQIAKKEKKQTLEEDDE